MECSTVISLIDAYNRGELAGKQKEQFLLHIRTCPKCYEELDIQFIVSEGVKGLDTNEQMDFDFSSQLHEKIEAELRKIRRLKHIRRILLFLLLLGMLVISGILIYYGF